MAHQQPSVCACCLVSAALSRVELGGGQAIEVFERIAAARPGNAEVPSMLARMYHRIQVSPGTFPWHPSCMRALSSLAALPSHVSAPLLALHTGCPCMQ